MHVHKKPNVEKHLAPLYAFVWECVNYITKSKAPQVYKSEQQVLTYVSVTMTA